MSINEKPEFASAVRGYDRQQVDDYVQVLLQYIDELNRRALSAEEKVATFARQPRQQPSKQVPTPPPQPPVQPPAERALHAVLAQVAEEARTMMEAARGQAEQVRAAARTDAAQALAAARAEADQIVRAAHAQAGLVSGSPSAGPGPSGAIPGGPPPPPTGRPPMEVSVSYQDHAGRELVLNLATGDRFSIGRAPGSDIQLPWDDAVSRRHARIERAGDDWVVVDDGTSSNGTFINEEQVNGKRRLRDGDVVRAGSTRLTFHARPGGPQRAAGPTPATQAAPV